MTPDILLILGGGCAGLSLALRLADGHFPYQKVIIIEKRDAYHNDRTWCFWDENDTPPKGHPSKRGELFREIVSKKWNQAVFAN